jgi:hypothetical protein
MRTLIIAIFLFLSFGVYAQKAKATKGYDKIGPYNKRGWAKVEKNGKQGYIDKSGAEVIECVYDEIYPFDKGKAKIVQNNKYGMVRESGEIFVAPKYDYIGPFVNGLAIITVNNKRGLLNEEGEEVVEVE